MDKNQKKFVLLGSAIVVLLTLAFLLFNFKKQKTGTLFNIGVLQFVEHEALDLTYKGFVDELSNSGFRDGENIKIEFKNAQGNAADCSLIANQFASDKKDLILAIATPAALSAANVTTEIPIVAMPITNFETSGLVKSHQKPETNVTGTSDLGPVSKQISLVKDLIPNAKTVGILYSTGEPNSQYQANLAIEECKKLNLTTKTLTFSQAHELQSVIESSKDAIDVIYAPTDNVVASNVDVIIKSTLEHKIPFFCCDKMYVRKGALGAYFVDYEKIGKLSAKQAIGIIKKENKPQNMPIEYLGENKLIFNVVTAKKIGLTIPKEFTQDAEIIEQ